MMLHEVKPKNARSKRALERKEPHINENAKKTLFCRGTSASQIVLDAISDLHSLKRPLSIKFIKKNSIHPFEDPSSLEFFSERNDTSLLVFGANSKKRPHCLTFIRTFNYKLFDMLELYIDPESFRTLVQFKNNKSAVGLRPLLLFAGTPFESPTPTAYTLAKSIFTDLFKGDPSSTVDVEGLQYMISISAAEEGEGERGPKIHFRVYLIRTKKSGQKLPRAEVEEMGPRIDFRIGRVREADESMMREALRKPKGLEPKQKKNVETDLIGDKIGRIHLGRQDLSKLQTRKMKGLKRDRDIVDGGEEDLTLLSDSEVVDAASKRAKVDAV